MSLCFSNEADLFVRLPFALQSVILHKWFSFGDIVSAHHPVPRCAVSTYNCCGSIQKGEHDRLNDPLGSGASYLQLHPG